jgi:hypothetical protein
MGISKQGDGYLRRLLVVGATAVLRHARKGNPGKQWAMRLLERKRPKVVAVPTLLELGIVALDPAHDRHVRQINYALCHHLYQFSETELEPQIPAHAQDDNFPLKMANLEKFINALHKNARSLTAPLRAICPLLRKLHQSPDIEYQKLQFSPGVAGAAVRT